MAGGAGETITFLFNFFSTGIKATPQTAVESQKHCGGRGKPKKHCAAAIPTFRQPEKSTHRFQAAFPLSKP
jgi:hypothetical protein